MRSFGNFVIGAVLGGILGSALAMLLAPSSGDELRKRISSTAEKIADGVQAAANERGAVLREELALLQQKPPAPDQA